MDPTDARALVKTVCLRAGVELGRVLGRERTLEIIAVRRVAILELRARGASYRLIGAALGRAYSTAMQIARRSVATHPRGASP